MDYDGALQNERQMLLQEQRGSRARAHKFYLETSRRKKALEDRRRQWDAQEQRIRENILQLRKQRMQEATERFQRAHIRPSQRRRPAFVKRTVNLDEALNLINARGAYAKPAALSRHNTPPPRPHTLSNSVRHQKELLATEANTKQGEIHRNYRSSQQFFLNDLQEAQGVLTDGEAIYPWEEHANQPSPSESLSSQDSLEIENLKPTPPQKSESCFQTSPTTSDKDSPLSPETYPNGLGLSSVVAPHQIKNCLFENLRPPSTAIDHSEDYPSVRDEFAEETGSHHSLTPAIGHHSLMDPSQDTQEQGTFGNCSLCVQLNNLDYMAHHNCNKSISEAAELHKKAVVNHHHGKPSACLSSRSTEITCWEQECRTVSGKLRHPEEGQSEYRLATQVGQTSLNTCKPRDPSPKNSISVVVSAPSQRGSGSDSQTNEAVKSDQSNGLQPHPDTIPKEETNGRLAQTMTSCPLSMATDVRFLKSILKKQSKYEAEETKFLYGPRHLIITKHMAVSLRDSIELMRGKNKEPENDRTVKKKLRWLDEVNVENYDKTVKDSGKSALKKSRVPVAYQQGMNQMACRHHAEAVSTVASTVPSSPLCPSARQAWADVAGQDSKPQEHPQDGLKTQTAFLCLGAPKVPRRVRSARGGTGHAPRVRKDVILRPQSATEASQLIKNQSKMIVPCPPPRAEVADRQTAAHSAKAAYADEKHSWSIHHADKTLYSHNPDAVCLTDEGVVFAPCPPPYAGSSPETVVKGRVSFNQHGSHASVRKCGAAFGENGICLNRTPTDDEISQLWNGVRSALSTKDDCANLSQFSDECVIGDVRSLAGMGGFYISPCNARHPQRRATQEGNGSKKWMLAQHTVLIPGSGNKKLSLPNQQASLMTMPLPSKVQDQGPSQRTGPAQHTPILSLSGLSLEEQRVQQSLDRLNQRLQHVVGGNPSVKRLFHSEATHHNMSAKSEEGLNSASRRLSAAPNAH